MASVYKESGEIDMTKQEYLNALNEKLRGYPDDFRREMYDTFETHFREGLNQGRSVDEIIADLGTVDEVAENIKMMNMGFENNESSSNELKRSLDSLSSTLHSTIRNVSSMVTDSVNTAVKNIEAYASNDHSQDSEGTIDTVPGTVLIIKGAYKGALDLFLKSGDRLDYHFSPTRSLFSTVLAKLSVRTEGSTVTFSADDSAHLHLTVPETVDEIRISLLSGDTEADGLSLLRLEGRTESGDWEFDNCAIEALSISTRSGDIDLDDTECAEIQLSTHNGDISLRRTSGSVDAQTASGDIDIREHKGNRIRLEAMSGDLDIAAVCPDIDLLTVSGDIDLRAEGRVERIRVSATSGDITAEIGDTDYTAVLQTVSGELSNDTGLRTVRLAEGEWTVGEGLASVFLKSASGDISLE
jgi:DUF4097 and DUF4098 domain-containing protein YvlB